LGIVGILVNMAFNMGIHGLMGFRNNLRLIEAGRWKDAAKEMLNSKWATQVGEPLMHRVGRRLGLF
jgi:lysozyme